MTASVVLNSESMSSFLLFFFFFSRDQLVSNQQLRIIYNIDKKETVQANHDCISGSQLKIFSTVSFQLITPHNT